MPITDLTEIIPANRIDPAMATDAETVAAIAVHEAASDPHPQYLTTAEGDTRYLIPLANFNFSVSPVNLTANTWQEVGSNQIFGELGKCSTWLLNFYFQYVNDTTGGSAVNQPFYQYCGAGVLGAIYWQADLLTNEGIQIPLETHNEADFTMRVRFGRGNQSRKIEVKPDRAIAIASPGFLQVKGIRLQ